MRRPARAAAAWLLALTLFACGHKTPPAVPAALPPQPAPATAPATAPPATRGTPDAVPAPVQPTAVEQLRAELDKLFRAPAFDRMLWGIQIQSLTTGEILYGLNATKLVMPASNMKIVTLAAAAERLGWDYAFETKLVATGPIERGVLEGDLEIVGSGDPTINGRSGSATAVFEDWAARLREAGISAIDGRIIADDRAFDDQSLGAGWSWDYLVYGYAARVTALQYNENVAQIAVRPGSSPGAAATVSVRPEGTGLTTICTAFSLYCSAVTGAA